MPLTWSFPRAGENADEDDDSSVVGSATDDRGGTVARGGRGAGGVAGGRRAMRNGHCPHEAEGEKFWGEILERSFSCHNLRSLVADNLDSLYSSSSSSNLRLSSCAKHKNGNSNGASRSNNNNNTTDTKCSRWASRMTMRTISPAHFSRDSRYSVILCYLCTTVESPNKFLLPHAHT